MKAGRSSRSRSCEPRRARRAPTRSVRSSPAVTRSSTPPSTGCAARPSTASSIRLSSAADHSLLWHVAGVAQALVRGGDLGAAARFSAAMGVESALTNGPVKAAFGRLRPRDLAEVEYHYGLRRPITSSFPSGSRDRGVLRRAAARRRHRLVRLGRRGRRDPGVRRPAPRLRRGRRVPRSGSCWAPGSGGWSRASHDGGEHWRFPDR